MPQSQSRIEKIRCRLSEKRLLNPEKFERCIRESESARRSWVEVLYRDSGVPEKELLSVLCEVFGYPPINVSTFALSPEVLSLVPKEIAKKHWMLPISRLEKTLTVALMDPTNLGILDDLHAIVGLRIKPTLAAPSQLDEAIKKYYEKGSDTRAGIVNESFDQIMQDVLTEGTTASLFKRGAETSDLLEEARATPIIQLVNHLLIEAIRREASDVFIEPWEKTMRVRFRVDGVLEEALNAPRTPVEAVLSRIKVMSRLNIAEHRIPQDGRIRVRILGREVDLRVSILPTSYGEKACLRILDSTAQAQKLEALGFGKEELEIIRRNAEKPHGMILATGPTGSGKTTTLYAILQYLDSPEKNITTVEDPVEYQVAGINQVNVREQVGLTFPLALRSILRQDPDTILIGEIRDLTTMDIAIKSALTGHLVLSTLHTNDATSTVVRMINMGIEPFLIASSVLLISAQRLVRKLCPSCRSPYIPDAGLLKSIGVERPTKATFYRPKGCRQCRHSGYKGRSVITELFELRPAVLDLIMKGVSGQELRRTVREMGMKTLRENGFEKAKEGLTSLEEVLRTTSPEPPLAAQKD